jgi:enediyne biosynthesis protein E4
MRVFAAGKATDGMRLEVQWRSGRRSAIDGVRANHLYTIDEADAQAVVPESKVDHGPVFLELESFKHTHTEPFFEDYDRQPLLPNRLSQLGPGVAWYDVNNDGWDDLIVGSGQGGRLALFTNDQHGAFNPASEPFLDRPVTRDQTSVLAIPGTILAGSANYEDGLTNGGYLRIYDLNRKVAGDSVLGPTSSTGPLALADVDGDGDLDLFVGGRVVAGRYPEPADSLLLRNEGGRLVVAHKWEKLGLVSGAVFSDIDLDGDPDLILACDWGPVRVFRNNRGTFTEVTAELGLAGITGWWTGVATGDFDSDGRPDLVVGNWGLNSQFQASPDNPWKVYFGDIDDDGIMEFLEATYDPILQKEVPGRGLRPISFALPWFKDQVGSFEAYGRASMHELYGDLLKKTAVVEVNTFASTIFFNRGDHFEPRSLPVQAQLTTTMGVSVGDYDGDGHDDVFLSQNFFAVAPEAWRQDAGRGLWLKGDGQGNLDPVPAQISGILVYGEQRGCALSDFDRDGRVDLVVTQNGAATRLYRNVTGKPGLRVRLIGPPGNPYAVGAMLRLKFDGGASPVREIQAGSGYLSHNSPIHVFGLPSVPRELEVRWPGGRLTRVPVPADALEIQVHPTGQVDRKGIR